MGLVVQNWWDQSLQNHSVAGCLLLGCLSSRLWLVGRNGKKASRPQTVGLTDRMHLSQLFRRRPFLHQMSTVSFKLSVPLSAYHTPPI